MARIRDTRRGVFVDDTSRPVHVEGRNIDAVLKSVGDASRSFGLTREEVFRACEANDTVNTPCGPITFSWPDLGAVRETWPNYPVTGPRVVAARPCTIHMTVPKSNRRQEALNRDVDTRSIRAARRYLGLSEREFDMVAHRLPGWRRVVPPHIAGITVHGPGHSPTNPVVGENGGVRGRGFFTLKRLAKNIRVTLTDGDPQYFPDIESIPDFVLANGDWETSR